MIRYIIKRLLLIIPVIVAVAILIFSIMYVLPGDPAQMIVGTAATPEEIQIQREYLGLDKPYIVQLGRFLYQIFIQFDFGTSFITKTPVLTEFGRRLPLTAIIAIGCLLIRVIVGLPLGMLAAVKRNKLADRICMLIALIGVSVPNFLVALGLTLILSVKLKLLPALGISSIKHFILPVIAASLIGVAVQTRQTRSSMLDVIRADYVTTARAKGISEGKILFRHVMPNGLIPVIQSLGNGFGQSLAGTLIIETVFSIPGMGVYMTTGVRMRDYPVVRSSVLMLAVFFACIMLLVDLAFAFIDPRIKAQYQNQRGMDFLSVWVMKLRGLAGGKEIEAPAAPDPVGFGANTDEGAVYLANWNSSQDQEPANEVLNENMYIYELTEDMRAVTREDAANVSETAASTRKDAASTPAVIQKKKKPKRNTHFRLISKRLLSHNRAAVAALGVLGVILLCSLCAGWIAPYSYYEMDLSSPYIVRSAQHWMGTDEYGRDILSRVIYGGRYSLSLGLGALVIPLTLGVSIGCIAGFFGGWVDMVIMRFLDVVQSVPSLLFCILISSALGGGMFNTVVALSIPGFSLMARLTRAQFLSLRTLEYVEAAAAINCSRRRQIFRHMLPNALSPLIVTATMDIGSSIMTAASLSYIGLGIQPPTPEWGAMIVVGRAVFREYIHLIMWPGLFLALVVLCLNVFGDGLRDAMDPKLKN
jgi:peptide/nickel transport system permease protein